MHDTALATIPVMVAEDCDYVRRMLADMLRSFGFARVHEVASGQAAMRRFRYVTPGLLIADWRMAPMDGIALVTFVRRDRASPNPCMPILMVTMNTAPECVFAARDAGVNEILAKPFAPATLEQKVRQVLSRPRPFVRSHAYVGPDRRRGAIPVARLGERRKEARRPHPPAPAKLLPGRASGG